MARCAGLLGPALLFPSPDPENRRRRTLAALVAEELSLHAPHSGQSHSRQKLARHLHRPPHHAETYRSSESLVEVGPEALVGVAALEPPAEHYSLVRDYS